MTRALYRGLLWLHPAFFRERFAGEMLWIFDQTVDAEGAAALFADGILSLLRQWLIRRMTWKVAAALVGALLQVGLVGALTVGHAARRALRSADISASGGAVAKDSRVQAAQEASTAVAPPSMTMSAAEPVGGQPLPFAVLFGIVFVYVVQKRLFDAVSRPAVRRRLPHDRTQAGQPRAGSKSPLSIVAD